MPKIFEPDLIDKIYGSLEEMGARYDISNGKKLMGWHPGFSRGDLITINGKTIREKMLDEYYARSGDPNLFSNYYLKNVAIKTSEYVQEALNKSQYIEMFQCDENGTIWDEPVQLVKNEDSEIAIPEESRQKVMDSRKQIKMYHLVGQENRLMVAESGWLKDYYGNISPERRKRFHNIYGNPNEFAIDRMSMLSLTLLNMAAKGYSLEEIVDPDKLKEEKLKAGEEILEHLKVKADKKVMAEEIADKVAENAVRKLKEAGVKPTEKEIKAAQEEIEKARKNAKNPLTEDEIATIALKKAVKLGENDISAILSESDVKLTEEEKNAAQEKYGEPLTENEIEKLTLDKAANLMADKAATLIEKKLPKTEKKIDVKLPKDYIQSTSAESVVKSKVHEEDDLWFAEQMLRGQYKLMNEIDRYFESLDWNSDSDFMFPKKEGIYAVIGLMFDTAQEIERIKNKEAVKKGAEKLLNEHPELGTVDKAIDEFKTRPKVVGDLWGAVLKSAEATNDLLIGNQKEVLKAVNVSLLRKAICSVKEAKPGITLSRIEDKVIESWNKAVGDFRNKLEDYDVCVKDPETKRLIGQEILSGKLQENLKAVYNPETGVISYDGTMTPKIEFAKQLEDNSKYKSEDETKWIKQTWEPLSENNLEKCYDTYREHYAPIVKDMLEDIEAVDPTLVRSSRQFSDMKKSLKKLNKLLKDGKEKDVTKLREACEKLQQHTQEYLDYKQADDRVKKRSDLEFKRVLTAQRLLRMSQNLNHLSAEVPTQRQIEISKDNWQDITMKFDQLFRKPVVNAIGPQVNGRGMDVMQHLKSSLDKRKEEVIRYVSNELPVKETDKRKKIPSDVKRAFLDLVAMEVLSQERIERGFVQDSDLVKVSPGVEEFKYSVDYAEYLTNIMNSEAFTEEMKNMSPENAKNFIMNDKAKEIAADFLVSVQKKNSDKNDMGFENVINKQDITKRFKQLFEAPVFQQFGKCKVKGRDLGVMDYLKDSIERRKKHLIRYVNGNLPVEGTREAEKNREIIKRVMADMITMEVIGRERIEAGFKPGNKSVKPGKEEREYAKDYLKYLEKITELESFKKEMSNMSPENMKTFVMKGKAREIASGYLVSVKKENSKQKNKVLENSVQNTNTNEIKKPAVQTGIKK